MSTLGERLQSMRAKILLEQTPETASTLSDFVRFLREDGTLAKALQPGDRAPDIALPDQNGREFRYSGLLDREPLVVSFIRGTWCRYCKTELSELSEAYPRILAAGGRLVAIAPQTPSNAAAFYAANPVPFPVLSDRESRTAAWFGLTYEMPEDVRGVYRDTLGLDLAAINDDPGWHLAMPARYIIDRGVVVYARVDPDPCIRPEPDDTIAFLEDLLR
jgi:peroxiredoxin